MATQLNFDQLKQELDRAQISTAAFVAEFNKLKASGGDVNGLLRAMDIALDGVKNRSRDINSTFGDLVTTLKNIVSEIGKSDSATKDATKAYRGLVLSLIHI